MRLHRWLLLTTLTLFGDRHTCRAVDNHSTSATAAKRSDWSEELSHRRSQSFSPIEEHQHQHQRHDVQAGREDYDQLERGDYQLELQQDDQLERQTAQLEHRRGKRQVGNFCLHNGELYRCQLSLHCIFSGGSLLPGCGNLLYACCFPESIRRGYIGQRHDRGFRFPGFPLPPLRPGAHRGPPRRQPHGLGQRGDARGLRHFDGRRRPSLPRRQFAAPPPPPEAAASGGDPRAHVPRRDFVPAPQNQISDSIRDKNVECGKPQPQIQKRIIGGREANYGELPWQAHIRILGYQCGGVLVTRLHVVTAAHCVHRAKMDDIKIHLGEYDTKDTGFYPEPYPSAVRAVVEVRINPRFHYMLTQPDRFDVAVLRLDYPVSYRANILPICLPPEGADYTGATAIVAGWGKTDNSFSKTGTNILNKVPVPIIPNGDCLQWHHQKHIDLQLHGEMFCAGHEAGQRDACLGDSGGPLIVLDKGRWTLAGITSAGFGCAVDHQPGIYHKVSSSAGWIRDNIRD